VAAGVEVSTVAMTMTTTAPEQASFDERWYLDRYPDVAAAIADGAFWSGWQHFATVGAAEGREGHVVVDVDWYVRSYPQLGGEIDVNDPTQVAEHYHRVGRHRGYLPRADAPRPDDAAAMRSRFGGLWIDGSNAEDLIAGKAALGVITDVEATKLRQLRADGVTVLEDAVPPVLIDEATRVLDACFDGRVPEARFECGPAGPGWIGWHPLVRREPAKALDPHWHSVEIRAAIFSPVLLRFLTVLFERPVLASQSLGFLRGSGQEIHQDSAYVAYSLPQQFAAAWIALEDVTPGAGELVYVPGSHRAFGQFMYPEGSRSLHEALRKDADPAVVDEHIQGHLDEIQRQADRMAMRRQPFVARRGDVLIWHADLAHGGNTISTDQTRKSIVAHFCPREVAPLYTESQPSEIRYARPHAWYTTSVHLPAPHGATD
jgi:Phytanoyl-CoA dioxygenase (PhyH)